MELLKIKVSLENYCSCLKMPLVMFFVSLDAHVLCFYCTLNLFCSKFLTCLSSRPSSRNCVLFCHILRVFAGTWSLIISAVRPSLGQWGNAWFYRCYESRSGPSLYKISVRLSVRLQAFDDKTERQVETFEFFILGEGVWSLLWL